MEAITNVYDQGKVHIWTNEDPDEYGGHYHSLCGHQFGINWRLSKFQFSDKLCRRCIQIMCKNEQGEEE